MQCWLLFHVVNDIIPLKMLHPIYTHYPLLYVITGSVTCCFITGTTQQQKQMTNNDYLELSKPRFNHELYK